MKSGENFNPDNYNPDERFNQILSEVTGKPAEEKREFAPPTINREDSTSSENMSKNPDVPRFVGNFSDSILDDRQVDPERHESRRETIEFGKKVGEVYDFTKKFNRALKIHIKRAEKKASENISEKTTEYTEKFKDILSNTKEKLSDKNKEDIKQIGRKGIALALTGIAVGSIFVATHTNNKGRMANNQLEIVDETKETLSYGDSTNIQFDGETENIEEFKIPNQTLKNVETLIEEKKEIGKTTTSENEQKTQEFASDSQLERLEFAKENISPEEAYKNIQSFIDNEEYLDIKGECTADYVAYVLSKTGHSAVQTAAYIGNMARESKICALLYEVGGDGYGLFQFTGGNRHGIKGHVYKGEKYACEHDGYEVWIEKNDADVYRYEFEKNPFVNVGYNIDAEKTEKILEDTGTRNLYKKAIARQIQYFYYGLANSNWERNQYNIANSAKDASTYALLFREKVERPKESKTDAEKRAIMAGQAYQLIANNESLKDLAII